MKNKTIFLNLKLVTEHFFYSYFNEKGKQPNTYICNPPVLVLDYHQYLFQLKHLPDFFLMLTLQGLVKTCGVGWRVGGDL